MQKFRIIPGFDIGGGCVVMMTTHLKSLVLVAIWVFTWPLASHAQSSLNCNDLLLAPPTALASEMFRDFVDTAELEKFLMLNPSLVEKTNSETLSAIVTLLSANGLSADQIKDMFRKSPNAFSLLNTEDLVPFLGILSNHFRGDELADWLMTIGVAGLRSVNQNLNENLAALEDLLGSEAFATWLKDRVGELPNLSLGSVQELMVTVSEFLSIDEATELILDNTSLVKYSATLKKVVATFGEFGWLESLPELLRSSFEDLVRLNPELLREFLQDLKRKFPGEARAYLLTKNIPVLSRAEAVLRTSSFLEDLAALASVSLDEQIFSGWSALTIAVYRGQLDTVKYLLGTGADVNARDKEGNTAIIWLARRSLILDESLTEQILNALVSYGANLDATNDLGSTALKWANLWGENPSQVALKDQLTALGARR